MAKYEKIFSVRIPQEKKEFYETLVNKYVDTSCTLRFDTIPVAYFMHEDSSISVNFVVEYETQNVPRTENFVDAKSFKTIPKHLINEEYHEAIVNLALASWAYNQMMEMLKIGFESLYLLDKDSLDKQIKFIENKNEFVNTMEKLLDIAKNASREIYKDQH